MGTFDIRAQGIGSEPISNALGIAVDPETRNIFLTTLSYGGADNLWQFSSDGTLINSVRVNIDLGHSGDLKSAVVGRDGHLFICAAKDMGSHVYKNSIIEVSQDGNQIFSSFPSDQYTQGLNGMAYNAECDQLLVSVYAEKKVFVLSLDGSLLNSYDVMNSPLDIAFDPLTKNILILCDKNIMDEYSKNIQGIYCALMSYSLQSVGISQTQLAFDIDRSSSRFYIQENNNRIVEFNRSELQSISIAH